METISHVTVNMLEPPASGGYQMITRMRHQDKLDVDKAAKLLGMSTAQFQRTTMVQAARKVIAEVVSLNAKRKADVGR